MISEAFSSTSRNIMINSAISYPFFIETESQFKEIMEMNERKLSYKNEIFINYF